MNETLQKILGLTLIVFMAGNLLEVGLKVNLNEVRRALRDGRFVGMSLLWGFLLCPAFAFLLTKIMPMAQPYALGLLFLGMAPGAPFLPAVARKAKGDLAYVAAFMVLTAVGTVIYMPLAVPVIVRGFSADTWAIAKPLVLFIAAPLLLGIAIRMAREAIAETICPIVRSITAIDTLIMLVLVLIIYGKDFVSAVGSFAIGAQILFCVVVTMASYAFGLGMPAVQKSVLALGVCTRNIGAAMAPLISVTGTDRRSIAMCALAVPITVVCASIAAGRLALFSSRKRAAHPTSP